MASYQEARVKLINEHLNRLKSAAKNNTATILRLNKKNVIRRNDTWNISDNKTNR